MGETDVREEILAPLVQILGYRTGTQFDVVREQSLRYPKIFLGRKNPTRDMPLRGKADYILEVTGHARWVLEAKAPGVDIDIDAIEQAWTYANHAEVRAVYFAICNGRELKVFATQSAPSTGAFLTVPYESLSEQLPQIQNILGPTAIQTDFPGQQYVTGHPLGPGLRAIARIASGTITYKKSSFPLPMLSQMQIAIVDGSLERDEDGFLLAYLRTQAPLRFFQELNERLGLESFEMKSLATQVSTDPDNPTVLVYSRTITFPEGSELLDTTTWEVVKTPAALPCNAKAQAVGYLKDWPAAGFKDTELGVSMKLEVRHGATQVYARVQS